MAQGGPLGEPARRELAAVAPSLLGAALLFVPAQRFRIDTTLVCERWPSVPAGTPYGAVYLAAVLLLTVGWLRTARAEIPLRRLLAWGALVHALAMISPPFLSADTLAYAAVGRAAGVFGADPYRPFRESLPAGDPFLAALLPTWRFAGSAYWDGFNSLAALIARAAGDRLEVSLRAFQAIGAASMVACAALIARTVRPSESSRAAALVLLCPLGVIEATANGHNDALLALAAALAALFIARRWSGAALAALIAGALVKASGLLLVGLHAASLALFRARHLLTARRVIALGLVGAGALVAAIAAGPETPQLQQVQRLLGNPHEAFDHCTRSVECLPRTLLRQVLHRPWEAWAVGLAFRVAGGLWMLWVAWRAATDGRLLRWAAAGLFIYYLFLHGFMQAWYLLPLVALLPHLPRSLLPAAQTFAVTSVAYYTARLPLDCWETPVVVVCLEVFEAAVVILPPSVLLVRALRDRGSRKPAR